MSREQWKAAKAEVDVIEQERDALMKAAVAHLDARYRAATERLDELADELPDVIGNCEGCSEPIFDGDPAHIADDVMLCSECAPSYRDMLTSPEHFAHSDTGEPMTAEDAQAICDGHVEAGGSLDDKMVSS